jgi:hypothetical protein
VYGSSSTATVSREMFAVFMEPDWSEPMDGPAGRSLEDTQTAVAAGKLPPGVPALGSRWKEGQNFAEFTQQTLASYY